MEAEGRFVMQVCGHGWYAAVRVTYSATATGSRLDPAAADDWQQSNGWPDAAVRGVAFGLLAAGLPGGATVTAIREAPFPGGTTPGAVAVAAVRAVWAAAGFEPPEELAARLSDCGPRLSVDDVGARLGCPGAEPDTQ